MNNKFEHKIIMRDRIGLRVNIEDEFFKKIFALNGFIAGGYARYVASDIGIEPNDMDIFCIAQEDFNGLKSWFDSIGKIQHESDFAIMYKIKEPYQYIKEYVQLIKPRKEGNIQTYGNPLDVIDNFDFTINMIAIAGSQIFHAECFDRHVRQKKLVFNNIHCPVGILVRLRKYLRKGFTIPIYEFAKIYRVWDDVDEETRKLMFGSLEQAQKEDEEDEAMYEASEARDEIILTLAQRKIERINRFRSNDALFRIFYID